MDSCYIPPMINCDFLLGTVSRSRSVSRASSKLVIHTYTVHAYGLLLHTTNDQSQFCKTIKFKLTFSLESSSGSYSSSVTATFILAYSSIVRPSSKLAVTVSSTYVCYFNNNSIRVIQSFFFSFCNPPNTLI